jgi:hypothetical protein
LEVICQAAGTSIAVQHVRELHREPFGVVAVVIGPLGALEDDRGMIA